MVTMLHNSGPFYMRRLPYRLGFRWFEEMERTKYVPDQLEKKLLGYSEWQSARYRLYWRGIPIGGWRSGSPLFRSHRGTR